MPNDKKKDNRPEKDPLWYKNAVIYEVHVRAFHDRKGDGIGDFQGLTGKLDYLQDLGITAIWLLPFYPSPLKDDGYDISDYSDIHPDYGTLADFKNFLREAHQRGLRVITELVLNHTSDQHPWFQHSRRAHAGDRWRDFYVWSDTPERYKDARIIFKDFEASNWTWDPLAKAYFWHRFYSHQPDLNFDNPLVRAEMIKVMDFWLNMGVDGLRLDAVPYLYEREGTDCENLPETYEFLKELRRHVDEKYGDRMLLAEANQWPEDAVAYFGTGKGDGCHMAFHFPLMPRLFMSVRMEDRIPILDILEQTPAIPETSQWALFLRNHDELTLEMVTDEERDYMFRAYAREKRARLNLGIRRRLAPLLGNDRKRIELLYALLFSLPGTPVLYYGDEIGMGENLYLGDRNGVRTPMQWSSERNAGFSSGNPQSLYLPIIVDPEYHYQAINVETQRGNLHSLLWWMKRILALRKHWSAFGHGTIEFLHPENRKILAFVRRHGDENILVVANLSRFVQPVELDLSASNQQVPVEIFGRTEFPRIGKEPYFLTLGPHSIFWFSLEDGTRAEQASGAIPRKVDDLPVLEVEDRWESVFRDHIKPRVELALQDYIRPRRWFGGKAREIKGLRFGDILPMPAASGRTFLSMLQVEYVQGDPETYLLPLACISGEDADRLMKDRPQLAIARLKIGGGGPDSLLIDAAGSAAFCNSLLDLIGKRRGLKGIVGELIPSHTHHLREIRGGLAALEPVPAKAEQSNTGILFGTRLILKLFRRIEEGINPDLEIGRFLTARDFDGTPPLAGALEYRREGGERATLAVLHLLVPESKDAWEYTLDSLGRYYERILSLKEGDQDPARFETPGAAEASRQLTPEGVELLGSYVDAAQLLGARTADLHRALASSVEDAEFAPMAFTPHYQRSLYQSLRQQVSENLGLLRSAGKSLSPADALSAQKVLGLEGEIQKRIKSILDRRLTAMRIRCHRDYHLGQVLYTGKDFKIIDFEGEPSRPLGERRIKRCALLDVASMLRSFDYAAAAALRSQQDRGAVPGGKLHTLEPWARFWQRRAGGLFLNAYLQGAWKGSFLPKDRDELSVLLDVFVLSKAVYELGYELNHRPDWVGIPLGGILQILEGDESWIHR